MTVRVYRSTDASAPSLTGQSGALCTVLDAVLVNGYGSQTAAGWTIAFTATNKRMYTMGAGGTGFSLQVDDSAPTTAKEARVTGFEVATSVTAGTGQFPTVGQVNIGTAPAGAVVIRKSTTADATARAWTVVANATTFYLFTETADQTAPIAAFPFMFGDFFSYKTSDAYACGIIGRIVENTASPVNTDGFGQFSSSSTTLLANVVPGGFAARSWTGVGGSVAFGKHIDHAKMGDQGGVANNVLPSTTGPVGFGRNANTTCFPYPNGPDGALWVSPVWLHHNGSVRGYLKGLWCPLHDLPLNHNDTFTVSGGNLNGKSMLIQQITLIQNTIGIGQAAIETSDTWA